MKKLGILLSAMAALLLSSCIKDQPEVDIFVDSGEDVTLTLAIPGNFDSALTRAADETAIENATIVVFAKDGAYQYHKTSTNLSQSGKNVTVRVNLRTDGLSYDILVFTNIADIFNDTQIGTALNGMTIANAYTKLKPESITQSGWNGDEFIMSGILKDVTLNSSTSSIGNVPLIRSLASVDVGLNWDSNSKNWQGLDNFELQEVYVYNANSHYTVVPMMSAFTGNDYSKVTSPTQYNFDTQDDRPTSIGSSNTTALKYACGNDNDISSRMYIAEANNSGNVAVIIKGKYNGVEYYYKMDFAAKNTDGTFKDYMNILRNHKYRFNVKNVQGPGYGSADEAFGSKSINIEIELYSWDENDLDTDYNGQYYISYSNREVQFSQFGTPLNENEVSIKTNASELKMLEITNVAAKTGEETWTEIAAGRWSNGHMTVVFSEIGDSGEEKSYKIIATCNEAATDDPYRESKVKLQAGNLVSHITLKQESASEYRLIAYPDPSDIISLNGNAQRVEMEVSSTHDYVILFINTIDKMLLGVYDAPTGGNLINSGTSAVTMPAGTNRKVYIDIAAYSGISRLGKVEFRQVASGSTAPALTYHIMQSKEYLNAGIGDTETSTATIDRAGKNIDIVVESNIDWKAKLTIGDTEIENEAELETYLNQVAGTGSMTVVLNIPENTTGAAKEFKLQFINATEANMKSQELIITQTFNTKPFNGIPAVPGVLGVGEKTGELLLSGDNRLIPTGPYAGQRERVWLVYFKWGSLIAMNSDSANLIYPDVIAWTPDEYRGEVNSWEDFSEWLGTDFPEMDLVNGYGDPCQLAVDGYGYVMPSGNPYQGLFAQHTIHNTIISPISGVKYEWDSITNTGIITSTEAGVYQNIFISLYESPGFTLPAAGIRLAKTFPDYQTSGFYWTRTYVSHGRTSNARCVRFNYAGFVPGTDFYPADYGMAVRCVRKQIHAGIGDISIMTDELNTSGGSRDIVVESNVKWNAEMTIDGVAQNETQMRGYLNNQITRSADNETVVLTLPKNETDSDKEIKLRFINPSDNTIKSQWLTITQKASLGTHPTAGIPAVPGVLGVGEKTGELLLSGDNRVITSGQYAGEQERVWIVYFKWGSLIAMNSDPACTTYPQTIAWIPEGYNGEIAAWDDFTEWTGTDFPTLDEVNGYGDPCTLAADQSGYVMPTGNPFQGFPIITEFISDNKVKDGVKYLWDSTFGTWETTDTASPTTQTNFNSLFGSTLTLPAAGHRKNNGILATPNHYWTSAPINSDRAYYLHFNDQNSHLAVDGNRSTGNAIRCVPES